MEKALLRGHHEDFNRIIMSRKEMGHVHISRPAVGVHLGGMKHTS